MQIGQCVECGGQAKPGMNKCPEHLVGIGLTPDRHNPKRTVIIWVRRFLNSDDPLPKGASPTQYWRGGVGS